MAEVLGYLVLAGVAALVARRLRHSAAAETVRQRLAERRAWGDVNRHPQVVVRIKDRWE